MRSIFIVGSPFCGSTIIGNTLNSHPQIFHAGEVDRLSLFARYHGADAHYMLGVTEIMSLLGYSADELITAKHKWQMAQIPGSLLRNGLNWLRSNQAV